MQILIHCTLHLCNYHTQDSTSTPWATLPLSREPAGPWSFSWGPRTSTRTTTPWPGTSPWGSGAMQAAVNSFFFHFSVKFPLLPISRTKFQHLWNENYPSDVKCINSLLKLINSLNVPILELILWSKSTSKYVLFAVTHHAPLNLIHLLLFIVPHMFLMCRL